MKDSDDDLQALRALPVRDADRAVAANVQSAALAAFDAAHGTSGARVTFLALRVWSRFGVPAVLVAVIGFYLRWAFVATAALYP